MTLIPLNSNYIEINDIQNFEKKTLKNLKFTHFHFGGAFLDTPGISISRKHCNPTINETTNRFSSCCI